MKKPDTIDLYKLHKADYAAPRKPALVDIGAASYLAVGGRGSPAVKAFQEGIGALYGVAYTVKMTRRHSGLQDYAICKLECLWWTDNEGGDFVGVAPERWNWKLLMRVPDFVGAGEIAKAAEALVEKGKAASVREVRLERLNEGRCVQMLHVGPYDREPETIERMRAFARERGLGFHGRHHEIYLSDPRRVAPEKLRTILRMPVR